mmetsp:Transcript_24464/g.41024  ORF Transcript_24464/g.41024 Transcript_24464/m.41024 type:complete len:500 (-) Transcript_24464:300-1799(-)
MNSSVSANVDTLQQPGFPSSSSGNKRPRDDDDQQDDSENEDSEERAYLDRFGFPRDVRQRVKVTAVNFSGVDLSLESPSVKGNGVKPCPRTSAESFKDWRFRYRYQTGRAPSKAESDVKKDVGKTNVRDRCTGGTKAKADFAQHDDVVEPIKTELEYWLGPNIKGGWKQARFKFVDWQGTPWTDELERSNCCKYIVRKDGQIRDSNVTLQFDEVVDELPCMFTYSLNHGQFLRDKGGKSTWAEFFCSGDDLSHLCGSGLCARMIAAEKLIVENKAYNDKLREDLTKKGLAVRDEELKKNYGHAMKESSEENCGIRKECCHERIAGLRNDCKCAKFGMVPCWIFNEPGYIYHSRQVASKKEMKVLREENAKLKTQAASQLSDQVNNELHSQVLALQAEVVELRKSKEEMVSLRRHDNSVLQSQVHALQTEVAAWRKNNEEVEALRRHDNSALQSLQTEVFSLRQATSNMSHLQCPVPNCKPSTFFFSCVSALQKHTKLYH